ncbi:hypothetical protein HYZ41_02090 [archaeon]|nr:hypothetical protein [archaeon]
MLKDIGWRSLTMGGGSFRNIDNIYLRQPVNYRLDFNNRIAYEKEKGYIIFREIIENTSCIEFLDIDILVKGIERPLSDDGETLEPKKLDKYIDECMDKEVVPFLSYVIADDVELTKGDYEVISQLKPVAFVYNDIQYKEMIKYKFLKEPEFEHLAGKTKNAILEAMSGGFNPHIISVSTAFGGVSIFKEQLWPHLSELGNIGTGIIHPKMELERGVYTGYFPSKICISFGCEEDDIAFRQRVSRDDKKRYDVIIEKIDPFWESLIKRYHRDDLIKR